MFICMCISEQEVFNIQNVYTKCINKMYKCNVKTNKMYICLYVCVYLNKKYLIYKMYIQNVYTKCINEMCKQIKCMCLYVCLLNQELTY